MKELQSPLDTITRKTNEALERVWHSDIDNFSEYMEDAYPDIVLPAVDMSTELGARYYVAKGKDIEPQRAPLPDVEALKASARWALVTGDSVTGLDLLKGTTQRRIHDGARNTLIRNVSSERGARWARDPEPDACWWCRMLSTRGFDYTSAEAAGFEGHGSPNRFHDDCKCGVSVWRPGMKPPSLEINEMVDEYQEASQLVMDGKAENIQEAYAMLENDGKERPRRGRPPRYNDPYYLNASPSERRRIHKVREGYKERQRQALKDKEAYRAEQKARDDSEYRAHRMVLDKHPDWPVTDDGYIDFSQLGDNSLNAYIEVNSAHRRLESEAYEATFHRKYGAPGKPDTIENASKWNVTNPSYNPDDIKTYTNCQRVAPTYEMRRRGYDVAAQPLKTRAKGKSGKGGTFGDAEIRSLFLDSVGKSQNVTSPQNMRDTILAHPEGSRGFVTVTWNSNSRHIYNWEKVNGKVHWVDAQTNRTLSQAGMGRRLDRVDWGAGKEMNWVMRVDNLDPNFENFDRFAVMRRAK